MKKINLKNVTGTLSNKEMKSVTGGSEESADQCVKCWMTFDDCVFGMVAGDCFEWGMAMCPWGFACFNCDYDNDCQAS